MLHYNKQLILFSVSHLSFNKLFELIYDFSLYRQILMQFFLIYDDAVFKCNLFFFGRVVSAQRITNWQPAVMTGPSEFGTFSAVMRNEFSGVCKSLISFINVTLINFIYHFLRLLFHYLNSLVLTLIFINYILIIYIYIYICTLLSLLYIFLYFI